MNLAARYQGCEIPLLCHGKWQRSLSYEAAPQYSSLKSPCLSHLLPTYLSTQLRAIHSLSFSCGVPTERDRVRPFAHLATHCVFDKLSVVQEEMLKPLLLVCAFASLSLLFRFQRELFSFSFSPSAPPSSQQGSKLAHTLSPNSKEAIHNSTLGFADIYLINLPGRTDKLDAFRLLASVTNLSYTVVAGVDGSTIQHIAWPGFYKEGRESNIGSWRAHMNAVASILDNRLSSALIIEDDADWDVNLKTQLTRFALGSRYILNAPISSMHLYPQNLCPLTVTAGICSGLATARKTHPPNPSHAFSSLTKQPYRQPVVAGVYGIPKKP